MKFIDKLERAAQKNQSLLVVGLDPQEEFLPDTGDIYTRLADWGKTIIEQTSDQVCGYKPNIAFYEQYGPSGLRALQETINAVPADIPVLLDVKRGDIGSTAQAYARAAYEQFQADAVTLSPYLGQDSIKPFLAEAEKFVFILCQTSNPSANEIQGYGTPPLYEYIARVSQSWGPPERVGLVIGATQPEALERVRAICPDSWFLAPGVGAQGADLKAALTAGLRADKRGVLVPVSRAVINAASPRKAAEVLREQINAVIAEITPKPLDPFQALVNGLFSTGCVKFGNFTLASGKQSPVYLDLRRLVSFPDVLDMAVEAYIDQLIHLDFDCLAGVPYAALPIAAIAASRLKRPMVYPRKEAKTHGTSQMVEGVFQQGQDAILLEDVITSGGSILTAAETLASAGLQVRDAVVLVDREQGGVRSLADQGIQVHAVLTMRKILERLAAQNLIDQSTYLEVKRYLDGEA
ncbi:MAG TPA: orotidine-5'-phosphate decarboxylase [Anaerolineaceae bacterium]|nr:orotidine-5'-phosphate decarboxylase [Chloroflexota bacterium]HOA22176.1 orotidine-5'-phosphate decarboxylase [Anaerolineaceae bacterium]